MALGNSTTIALILLSIIFIIVFSINIYFARQNRLRAQQLAENGQSNIRDYTTWSYVANISGIILALIILFIVFYQWFKTTQTGSSVIEQVTASIPQSIRNIPQSFRNRFTPSTTITETTTTV